MVVVVNLFVKVYLSTYQGQATHTVGINGITDGVDFLLVESTTYTVTGTDINNCVNTSQVTINVTSQVTGKSAMATQCHL